MNKESAQNELSRAYTALMAACMELQKIPPVSRVAVDFLNLAVQVRKTADRVVGFMQEVNRMDPAGLPDPDAETRHVGAGE